FDVERRAIAEGRPQPAALPATVRIVDAAVHPFGIVAHRVGDAHIDPIAVDQREQRLIGVAGRDRNVLAEPRRVELVDPGVIARLGRTGVCHVLQLRTRERIERPAFRAVLAGCGRAIERALALAAVEARHVTAGERNPRDAVAVDVMAARAEAGRGYLVD